MLKRQRTLLGRVLRDIERKMTALDEDQQQRLLRWLERARRIGEPRAKGEDKLYALHAPEVECFAKGKQQTDAPALSAFHYHVTDRWRRRLRRRSQKHSVTWGRITRIADAWPPKFRSFIRGLTSALPSNT